MAPKPSGKNFNLYISPSIHILVPPSPQSPGYDENKLFLFVFVVVVVVFVVVFVV